MQGWFVFARIIDPTVTRVLIAPRFLAHVPIRRGIPEDIGPQLRCDVFSSDSFFTEITVGGCKLAGIRGRGGPRNLRQFFPSEIDLGGCKLSRESLSLRAELSSVFCALKTIWVVADLSRIAPPVDFSSDLLPLKTTWVVAWLASTSIYDELENIPQTFSL
jgi:hypothetical protein